MTVSLDKDLLDTMTPEERAEIEGADDTERASLAATGAEKDPQHTAGNITDTDPDADDDDKDDDAAAPGADAAAAPAAAPAPAPAADAGAPTEGEQTATPAAADDTAAAPAAAPAAPAPLASAPDDPLRLDQVPTPAPVYRFELPADFEERMGNVRTAQETLLDRFEAGELTREELRAEQEKLAEQRRELDSMRNRAEVAADMARHAEQAYKEQIVNTLFDTAAKPEHGGVDYRKDQAKLQDLDMFMKRLASDEANADKPLPWFLNEAHRRVRALHGLSAAPAPAPAPAPAAAKAAAPAPSRKPNIPTDAVDLSTLPGGADASDTEGEFADIYALEGEAFEQALENMARKQPERFARFQAGQH